MYTVCTDVTCNSSYLHENYIDKQVYYYANYLVSGFCAYELKNANVLQLLDVNTSIY